MVVKRSTPTSSGTGNPLTVLSEAIDPAVAGAKAAALARLRLAGFDVPDGFVIPSDVIQRFDSQADEIRDSLSTALNELGPGPFAVRSSGVSEDLNDASHAGQYETVLNVYGVDDALEAIRTVARSADSARIAHYREAVSPTEQHSSAIAVLIQPMIDPEAAGVAFSANPVTGDREEVIINAVQGIADRLMDGEVSAEEWTVCGASAVRRSDGPDVLGADAALRVAALARGVEAAFGEPQDIEWTIAGEELLLLQARPITALPIRPDLPPPPPGFWSKEEEHFSPPVSPMLFSIQRENMPEATYAAFEDFGLLVESMALDYRAGEIYETDVPLGGKNDDASPPWWLFGILVRVMPSMRRRMRIAADAIRNDLEAQIFQRWDREWKPEMEAKSSRLRRVDLPSLINHELHTYLNETREMTRRGFYIHFQIGLANLPPVYRLVRLCDDLFGWDEHKAMTLLYGASDGSSVGSRDLDRIAELIRHDPTATELLTKASTTIEMLEESTPEIANEILSHLHTYGERMIRNDPMSPTFLEVPSLTLQLLRDRISGDASVRQQHVNETRRASEEEAEMLIAMRSAGDRARFEHVLRRAQWAYGLRETNVYPTLAHPFALLRYGLLEAGKRLSNQGHLDSADDVFYCHFEEVISAVAGHAPPDLAGTARRRRLEILWTSANPGPATFGSEPGMPDLRGLPKEAREIHEAMIWATERMRAPKQSDGDGLTGVPASAGRYQGPVRVIRNEQEFHRLQAGDVLVCPSTSSSWAVLFGSAGALVTDQGGSLSHPAIIAREHGIPAVVATGRATQTLVDGQIVIVDGSTGKIEPVEAR